MPSILQAHKIRPSFRFSLRAIFVMVTVFALWLGWELKFISERRAIHKWVVDSGGVTVLGTDQHEIARGIVHIPFWRRWLGDYAVGMVKLEAHATPADVKRVKAAFPEVLYCEAVRSLSGIGRGTSRAYGSSPRIP
jgi:hypothetical protein